MLYELTTGRRPFAGTSGSDVMVAILEREPAPLARFDPQLPGELQRIIGKALRKDREQRYQVIKDLRLDLEALRGRVELQARSRPTLQSPPQATCGRLRRTAPVERRVPGRPACDATRAPRRLVLALLLVLAALTGWWMVRAVGVTSSVRCAGRSGPTDAHAPDLRSGAADRPRVVTGRAVPRLLLRPERQFDIWVQPVGGGDPVQVTRSPAQDTQPAWSPDGGSLVFRSERDGGGLYIVPALGGMERQLTSFGTHPSWPSGFSGASCSSTGSSRETPNGPRGSSRCRRPSARRGSSSPGS